MLYHETLLPPCSLSRAEYRDKVLGCWTGKNIGGTLGAPFECRKETFSLDFYTQDLDGEPEPNDDLDIQLVWLEAVERFGIREITPARLGEFWMDYVVAGWNEYGVAGCNIRHGIYPPLSGVVDNNKWRWSNGAWIRSELWACLFPGTPEDAGEYAWMDASVDHCGEGIYAELFTAALESAAFVISDLKQLIACALSKIPADSRVARSVKLACNAYESGRTWQEAREEIVRDSADLGWFMAPANVAFVIVGLLYGEGDFGRTVCTAVNCGDDTDCTGATAGAVMGILSGRSGIPERWTRPIGERIKTIAINPFPRNIMIPETLGELTNRVISLAEQIRRDNPRLPGFTDSPQQISEEYIQAISLCSGEYENKVMRRSSLTQVCEMPYGRLELEFPEGIELLPGGTLPVIIRSEAAVFTQELYRGQWLLPEGWQAAPGSAFSLRRSNGTIHWSITAGEFTGPVEYLPLEVCLSSRLNPIRHYIPIVRRGALGHNYIWAVNPILRTRQELAGRGER